MDLIVWLWTLPFQIIGVFRRENELEPLPSEKNSSGKILVPSLAFSSFSSSTMEVLTSLLLVDIALTFFGSSSPASVGKASQIVTLSNLAAVLFGLLTGVLSVRFRNKLLLLLGALIVSVGVSGCFLASNFTSLQIFYSLYGVGSVMVGSMAVALIGENLPLGKRPKAIGWIVAATFLASAVGGPICGLIAGFGTWRSALLWFVLPVSIAGIVLAFFGIPSRPQEHQLVTDKEAYLSGLKQVFFNRSAAACNIGRMLSFASGIWAFFAITFFRQYFQLSTISAAGIIFGATLSVAFGSLVGGRLVVRFGRKSLTVWASLGSLTLILLPEVLTFGINLWIILALNFFGAWLAGVGITASSSLGLEQAPKSRGTMMSVALAFGYLGRIIGVAVGGAFLIVFGYPALMVAFGTFGIAAGAIVYFWANDPCKT